jgi:hypothetical protein
VPAGQVEEILALTIVFVVHVVGGLLLVWGVLGDEGRGSCRGWWRRRGDDGGGPPREPQPSPPGERLPWPLQDAAASRVRLRERGRVGDGYRPPARRPEHPAPPSPWPAPAPPRRQSD